MPDEDKTFSGSLFLDLRIWWRHVYTLYVASSSSGQDESNSVLWLANRAAKMGLSCPLGATRRFPQEKFSLKP